MKVREQFLNDGQEYLSTLYTALFTSLYYGMFRIGEVTFNQHVVKVNDVQVATNKNKMLFILRTSKTHGKGSKPQQIKIKSELATEVKQSYQLGVHFCPFDAVQHFIQIRPKYENKREPFFVFRDNTPVQPSAARKVLKKQFRTLRSEL